MFRDKLESFAMEDTKTRWRHTDELMGDKKKEKKTIYCILYVNFLFIFDNMLLF